MKVNHSLSGVTKIEESVGFRLSGYSEEFFSYYIHTEEKGQGYIVRKESGLYFCETHDIAQKFINSI